MLSLIAIAKNEAAGMADFLIHHTPLCDEIIVVDTGSDDGTARIAEAHGAKVFTFAWCDDFAVARNFSLSMATCAWVMYLDIDERIDPSDFPRLRQAIKGRPTCYQLPQWNYYNDPRHMEWQPTPGRYPEAELDHRGFFQAEQYRLFPNGHGLRWEGRVHEDMSAAVAASGLPRRMLDVPIHHYGYVQSDERNRSRNTFYGRLVRRNVDDRPEDPKALLELGYILIQEGQSREAIPVLEKAVAMGAKGPVLCRVSSMLATLYQADGQPDEAIDILYRCMLENPSWLFGWRDLITMLMDGGHWEQASLGLQTAKESVAPESLERNPALLKLECRLLVKTRRLVEAIPVARKLAREYPDLEDFDHIADQCEALAKKEGLL